MKRLIPVLAAALALAACSEGPTEGTAAIASVQLTPDDRTLAVGETLTLELVARDAGGEEPSGGRMADTRYATDAPAVATVSADGVVTGVAPGTANITATLEEKSATVQVRVATAPPACTPAAARTLAVGEALVLGGVTASTLCLSGGPAQTEYVAVPFHSGDVGQGTLPFAFTGSGFIPPPVFAVSGAGLPAPTGPRQDVDFHQRLREVSARELEPLRGAALSRSPRRGGAGTGPSLALNLDNPTVGQEVRVNTNARVGESCSNAQFATARVMAVGTRSVVLADLANPAGGLTPAEYQSFAAGFDTLVYPGVTEQFGTPEDVDGNGRVVIFYTKAVNELTSAGSGAFVAGFFHPRDLFPRRDADGLAGCAGTNYAEMFYMLVPDPSGTVNGNVFTRQLILETSLGTIAHEFQHLISASRRLYLLETSHWNEVTWLNEGMSHVAEEVMFYRATGLQPRQNLGPAEVRGAPRGQASFSAYMDQNLRRYERFLQDPSNQAPYDPENNGDDNDLATRGASWAFLRYAADRHPGDDGPLWRALVGSDLTGLDNLRRALGDDPREWIRDWTTSAFTDDVVLSTDPRYQQPSWRFRALFPRFPLEVRPLTSGTQAIPKAGSGAFLRFSIAPAAVATLNVNSGGNPVPSRGYVTVVRIR